MQIFLKNFVLTHKHPETSHGQYAIYALLLSS